MAGDQDQSFISLKEFKSLSSRIIKWAELPLQVIYHIKEVKEKNVKIEGEDRVSKYAVLVNGLGELTNVWLTSVIQAELAKISDFERYKYLICSHGLRTNNAGTRKYYDFELVKKDIESDEQ